MGDNTSLLGGLGRRRFLTGTGAVATGLTISTAGVGARAAQAAVAAATGLVRRDVWTLGTPWDDYVVAYAKAVRLMQQRPVTDPTSWAFQAAIHGTFARPAPPTWNQCQHQSWHFFPWHRMYLHFFERIVRAAIAEVGGPADWALPYWNWSNPFPSNTLPAAFREPALPDGSGNPLYLPSRRSDAIMAGFQLTPRQTSTVKAMATTVFSASASKTSFGGGPLPPAQFAGAIGALEASPHNVIHVQVGGPGAPKCTGGWMGVIKCAANDPIFYLHHANIDRLWDPWLAQGGGRANPTDPAWLNQTFTFHDETGQAVTMRSGDVLDAANQLGYAYA